MKTSPSLGPTVIASQVAAVLEAAVHLGLDRAALLTAAGLGVEALADPDARVPFSAEVALWEAIEARFPGELIGLALAHPAFDSATFGAVGFAARASADLGGMYDVVARYCRLVNEGTETRLVREGAVARLVDGPRSTRERWPRSKAEFVFGGYVIIGRRWTGRDWSPREVRFQHAAPARTGPYAELFRSRISFGQARNELLLDADVLAAPLRHSDAQLSRFLRRHADGLLRTLDPAEKLTDVIRRWLARDLSCGAPRMAAAARELGVSPRTLQRRLAALGTPFATLVDEARREVALRCLAQPGATEGQLAFLTGFSDDRAFRRAFRRWTGLSPAAWRAGGMAHAVRERGVCGPSGRRRGARA